MKRITWSMLAAALLALSLSACADSPGCAPVAQNGAAAQCVPTVSNYGDYDPNMHGNYPD
jgi:hypothetical protein